MSQKTEAAEQRLRTAFERLREDRPQVLALGTSVSQNNVARHASTHPTALRKERYSALIYDIEAWVEISKQQRVFQRKHRYRQSRYREAGSDCDYAAHACARATTGGEQNERSYLDGNQA